MAKYGSPSLVVEFDNSGGTLVDMSQHVREINGIEIEKVLEQSEAFGDAWFESLAVGMRKVADITIGGYYDDAASTGPDVIFNDLSGGPSASTRTFKLTWGSTKTTSVETHIMKYSRLPKVGALHQYKVVLRPTGAVTEA